MSVTDLSSEPSLDELVAAKRPPGLLIAILTTGLIYGIAPILPFVLQLLFNTRGDTSVSADMPNLIGWLNIIVAVVTLGACVLAWRGRPRWSRLALIGIVWVASVVQFLAVLSPSANPSSDVGSSSLDGYMASVAVCQFVLFLLVPVYLTWYLNRPPARAFYR